MVRTRLLCLQGCPPWRPLQVLLLYAQAARHCALAVAHPSLRQPTWISCTRAASSALLPASARLSITRDSVTDASRSPTCPHVCRTAEQGRGLLVSTSQASQAHCCWACCCASCQGRTPSPMQPSAHLPPSLPGSTPRCCARQPRRGRPPARRAPTARSRGSTGPPGWSGTCSAKQGRQPRLKQRRVPVGATRLQQVLDACSATQASLPTVSASVLLPVGPRHRCALVWAAGGAGTSSGHKGRRSDRLSTSL